MALYRSAIAAVVAALALAPSADAAQTVVTLTFDDGIATQNLVRAPLSAHGMHGTFYINSANVNDPENPYYMSWADVDALNAAGHEIGGHTLHHARLTDLTAAQQRQEICDDADALRARGYTVTDFAYPFGAGSSSSSVRSALVDCGFVSARNFGDLYSEGCTSTSCPFAEAIPPADPYAIRTPEWQPDEYTLSELEAFVTQAESHGGGWVPLVFHDICNQCADSSVSLSTFTALLDWLEPRAANGTIVRTVREVMLMNPGYARPKGATPFRTPLVPAFDACTAPNSAHGSPLASGSCRAPAQSSDFLTVGTPDANGKGPNSIGSVLLSVIPGNLTTTADEADVSIAVSISDVRRLGTLSDYTGQLDAKPQIRLTDKLNGPQQSEPGTVSDFGLEFTVPCTATSNTTIGSSCAVTTTADALKPGMVRERARAIWGLGQVTVDDGGPDGVASTQDNSRFAVQGIFVP